MSYPHPAHVPGSCRLGMHATKNATDATIIVYGYIRICKPWMISSGWYRPSSQWK